MLALHVEIECLKSLMESISKPPSCHSSYLSYVSLSSIHTIVANGTCVLVVGCGNVSHLPSLNLKDFLYVLEHYNYLVSIQKFTHDLNCFVTLFPTHCVSQDLATSEIGTIKEQGGLSCFENLETKANIIIQRGTSCLWSCTT